MLLKLQDSSRLMTRLRVDYPDLEDDKYHALAEKYLPNGSCGVLSFAVKGGRDCAVKFMDSLKLCDIETHVADAKTCILHPASHTHRQMTDEQLIEAGVAPRPYQTFGRS